MNANTESVAHLHNLYISLPQVLRHCLQNNIIITSKASTTSLKVGTKARIIHVCVCMHSHPRRGNQCLPLVFPSLTLYHCKYDKELAFNGLTPVRA